MTDENNTSPSFGNRMGSAFREFLRALLRLLVIAVVLGLLAVLIFWGVPWLNQQYVQPFQDALVELQDVQAGQQQTNEQILQSLDDLKSRINTLEVQNDQTKQDIDELMSQVANLQDTQQGYLDTANEITESNQAAIEEVNSALEQLSGNVEGVENDLEQSNEEIAVLEERIQALEDAPEVDLTVIEDLRREVQLVKAMELLTRARLFLADNNLGLTEDEISSARDLLVELPVPEEQEDAKQDIIDRLDMALENLPDSPVLAAENLEIAWQLLKQSLSIPQASTPESDASVETSTPGTPSPTPEETVTPTPTPSS